MPRAVKKERFPNSPVSEMGLFNKAYLSATTCPSASTTLTMFLPFLLTGSAGDTRKFSVDIARCNNKLHPNFSAARSAGVSNSVQMNQASTPRIAGVLRAMDESAMPALRALLCSRFQSGRMVNISFVQRCLRPTAVWDCEKCRGWSNLAELRHVRWKESVASIAHFILNLCSRFDG